MEPAADPLVLEVHHLRDVIQLLEIDHRNRVQLFRDCKSKILVSSAVPMLPSASATSVDVQPVTRTNSSEIANLALKLKRTSSFLQRAQRESLSKQAEVQEKLESSEQLSRSVLHLERSKKNSSAQVEGNLCQALLVLFVLVVAWCSLTMITTTNNKNYI